MSTNVEFDAYAYPNMVDAFRHADGSITYIVYDDDAADSNPRDYDGNIATLIQGNSRCIDLDLDDAGLSEAARRFELGSELFERYLAMFRPDILHVDPYWSAGDSYGWGYVTRENWERAMGEDYDGDVTPESAFDAELKLYREWAEGEVYGAHHVTIGDPIVVYGDHGAYVDGYLTEDDSCWGFLGYDNHQDIAATFTNSPITEVLA